MHSAWAGLSFEMSCLSHVEQIKKALGITGIQQTKVCSWRGGTEGKRAQIDLLIDRKDETVNICEIKFYDSAFEISSEYEARLKEKLRIFAEETHTGKSMLLTMITVCGVKQNLHSDIVQSHVTLGDLFE